MKTVSELRRLYDQPLLELIARASDVHRQHRGYGDIQKCALLSIKTGGCPEDCAYCPQSAHYATSVSRQPLLTVEEVCRAAERAKQAGATRFCMGAAWRSPPREGPEFQRILDMVRAVRNLGMEVCVTLGMLTAEQARQLKEAGLTAYNHNLDTSRQFYPNIITTRTYEDRLATLRHVAQAGISVCSGGIIGMGESIDDRLAMLAELAQLDPPPESIPINCLIPIPGTPLEHAPPVPPVELVRLIAVARITFPASRIRLSAGRHRLSQETQILCFLAGADSIFYGDKLLTAPNPDVHDDMQLFNTLQGAAQDCSVSKIPLI
ncbi:MAG: biotin synthase BioB [Gemmataceae bacterium]|nr:biotin synthase BioB [Gemmataceae bacterium]MDW8241597.1 biotin synthase BioB [Thermogemmata sp.]